MKPAGILTNVFLVLGALTIAGAASLPFRRTSIFRVRILFLYFTWNLYQTIWGLRIVLCIVIKMRHRVTFLNPSVY